MFLSTFINKIDKKGRVSVPASFRVALSRENFQGIVGFRSYKYAAIEGCGIGQMATLSNSIDELDLYSDQRDDISAAIFADACELAFDGEGRITLPQLLLDHAGITEKAAFVGRGPMFQIWEPKTFEAHQERARERVKSQKLTLRLSSNASSEGKESGDGRGGPRR